MVDFAKNHPKTLLTGLFDPFFFIVFCTDQKEQALLFKPLIFLKTADFKDTLFQIGAKDMKHGLNVSTTPITGSSTALLQITGGLQSNYS